MDRTMGNVEGSDKMERMELIRNRYVEFFSEGYRLGRITKINGNVMTVILAPFGVKGNNKGQRKRIRKEEIVGIVWRKKVIRFEGGDRNAKTGILSKRKGNIQAGIRNESD